MQKVLIEEYRKLETASLADEMANRLTQAMRGWTDEVLELNDDDLMHRYQSYRQSKKPPTEKGLRTVIRETREVSE